MRVPGNLTLSVAPLLATLIASTAWSQPAPATAASQAPVDCQTRSGPFEPPMAYLSVEQIDDHRLTFRICAPRANTVAVSSPDIAAIPSGYPPGTPAGLALSPGEKGIWHATTATPVAAGNYRFVFLVDGVRTPDPQGTTYSVHQSGVSSTVEVKGAAGDFQSYHPVLAHGAVQTVHYWSGSLQTVRQAHIYTPPGYMKGSRKYPVLYLVHGAGDSDDSWTSIGHAQNILDNLIAAGKAVPMIVVMPFGHTPPVPGSTGLVLNNPAFGNDLLGDLMPYIETNYRTINTADARAMAGLSMGGAHTLNYGLPHPERFHYVGVFSMGLGFGNNNSVAAYEAANADALKQAARQMKLVYYAIGRTDFLYNTSAPTRELLQKYGIKFIYHESDGGHTWMNWRDYLADFAPRLFR
jgi:enterochelin esterase-like enzyme